MDSLSTNRFRRIRLRLCRAEGKARWYWGEYEKQRGILKDMVYTANAHLDADREAGWFYCTDCFKRVMRNDPEWPGFGHRCSLCYEDYEDWRRDTV